MEKLVYLCFKRDSISVEVFKEKLLGEAAREIIGHGAQTLAVNVADLGAECRDSPLILGEGRALSAAVSLWVDSLDGRAPIEGALRALCVRVDGYVVTESVPRRWAKRTWRDGERSPGATLVTAFPKPHRLTDEEFLAHWHGVHTPLSFEVHPFVQYVRNVVARPVTGGAPEHRGIVEERVTDLADLLDIGRLFRGDVANMTRAMKDVDAFLDRDTIHTSIMSEYILRSDGRTSPPFPVPHEAGS